MIIRSFIALMGVFTEPVIEIEIEIRGLTKNVEFQFQADHD